MYSGMYDAYRIVSTCTSVICMRPIKVFIVDDSVVVRRVVSRSFEVDPAFEVVGTSSGGKTALNKVNLYKPDLVILDYFLPDMNGPEILVHIKEMHPDLPVLMFSALPGADSRKVDEVKKLGAVDLICKPEGLGNNEQSEKIVRNVLIPRIRELFPECTPINRSLPAIRPAQPDKHLTPREYKIIAIGVSFGGPDALMKLMPAFPKNFPLPIVIVQHMPAGFTRSLASRLDNVSAITVAEAEKDQLLQPGEARIAPGGYHLVVQKKKDQVLFDTNEDPPEEGCRPAVDVLFRSVARVFGDKTLAVILTGMGKDGLNGSKEIVEAGGTLLAQDESTSMVWGMPGRVTEAGLTDKVLPLEAIVPEILSIIKSPVVV